MSAENILKIDKKLLDEDIKFPLKYSKWSDQINDSNNNLVLDIEVSITPATGDKLEAIFNNYYGNDIPAREVPKYMLNKGVIHNMDNGKPYFTIRGWGRLSYKDKAEKRQDNIARFILNALNSDHGLKNDK